MTSYMDLKNNITTEFQTNPSNACELFQQKIQNKSMEPILLQIIQKLIKLSVSSKDNNTQIASKKTLNAFFDNLNQPSAMTCVEEILSILKNTTKWQEQLECLESIQVLLKKTTNKSSELLPEIIPVLTDLMWSTKKTIKKNATKTLKKVCKTIENKDLEPFIPALISSIANPEEVTECVHKLAATTFVQTVNTGTIALVEPLLVRGFKNKNIALTRKCAVISENISKLVENPNALEPFIGHVLPNLKRAKEEISDEECRSVCQRAYDFIESYAQKIHHENDVDFPDQVPEEVSTYCNKLIKRGGSSDDLKSILNDYVDEKELDLGILNNQSNIENEYEIDKEKLLCDVTFSLAYGSKILLNSAKLTLERGKKYGIVAQKSAGKTTLLKSIANYQIDGFPTRDELKTVFVDTDVQGYKKQQTVSSFCQQTTQMDIEDCNKTLLDVGFTQQMLNQQVTTLSGGWRMKLALARAMLRNADILLMDDPTNHLDVLNVQWVIDYINSETCKNITFLIISNDTGFLDHVATDIIHFNNLKLYYYKGNLSKFVEIHPETKSYYDLNQTSIVFSFPKPGVLNGVNSRGKTILQMQNVSFKYPSAETEQLKNVNVKCSMASRVACVGANGAGKSTLIKILTGELEPSKGSVIKNPNLRFAYVSQHAFHHIEQHLNKTPNEYIQWRYSNGEDKEALKKSSTIITEEEEKIMKKPIEVIYEDEDGKKIKEKRIVEKIVSRRKTGKKLEYEVKWVNKSQDLNTWLERDYLCDIGFIKLLEELDRRITAMEGSYNRVLSQKNIEAHLSNVGLDRELATHTRISSLSDGQKVKVVIGACMWNQPHLVILDEPSNYLDTESLGALGKAIIDFEGGVVLITHNKKFAEFTTRETWVVANNVCDIQGDADWELYAKEAIDIQQMEDMTDAAGNKLSIKKTPASVNAKEKKKIVKTLKKKIKNNDELTEFEYECATEWNLWV